MFSSTKQRVVWRPACRVSLVHSVPTESWGERRCTTCHASSPAATRLRGAVGPWFSPSRGRSLLEDLQEGPSQPRLLLLSSSEPTKLLSPAGLARLGAVGE